MRTRLAFGMSMAMSFDYYLVDEVISVGDERFRKKTEAAFQDKIRSARMIMISHSIRQIRQYCSCGLLLANRGAWYFDDIEALVAAYRRA
jgi:capsular polysaccharide transport system ATP-binding protein